MVFYSLLFSSQFKIALPEFVQLAKLVVKILSLYSKFTIKNYLRLPLRVLSALRGSISFFSKVCIISETHCPHSFDLHSKLKIALKPPASNKTQKKPAKKRAFLNQQKVELTIVTD